MTPSRPLTSAGFPTAAAVAAAAAGVVAAGRCDREAGATIEHGAKLAVEAVPPESDGCATISEFDVLPPSGSSSHSALPLFSSCTAVRCRLLLASQVTFQIVGLAFRATARLISQGRSRLAYN